MFVPPILMAMVSVILLSRDPMKIRFSWFQPAQNTLDFGFSVNLFAENPRAIEPIDFNGDGLVDVAVSEDRNDNLVVYRQTSPGVFDGPDNYPLSGRATSIVHGDFNEDEIVDLVIAVSGGVDLLLGIGDGRFAAVIPIDRVSSGNGLAVGDVNQDGHLDLVTVNQTVLGNGRGKFVRQDIDFVGKFPKLNDFDDDGILDVVAIETDGAGFGRVLVQLGNGDGTFGQAFTTDGGRNSEELIVADLNDDGIFDVVLVNSGINAVSGQRDEEIVILVGVGDGTFLPRRRFAVGAVPESLAVGDFDGDGRIDIATSNDIGEAITLLFNLR